MVIVVVIVVLERSLNVTAGADRHPSSLNLIFYLICVDGGVFSEWCTSFFFVFLCFASLIRVIMVLSGFIYLGLKTMPKDIVSKFCFLLGKCGQQVDIKGTIRDSYLFEVD